MCSLTTSATSYALCASAGDRTLVTDHFMGEADQDRCQGRASWPLHHASDGGSRDPKIPARRNPAADRRFATSSFATMTILGRETSKSPDRRAMPHECRSAPAQHEIMTAPAVQSPNQPHRTRRSLCNVPTSAAFALDSRLCYHFPRVEGVIRGISV